VDNNGFERIKEMLERAHTDAAVFPPTDLYNEGWMLRILLSIQSEGTDCFPFLFQPEAKWFSEALIASPFLPRFRGDPLAEGYTHADGVIGHFKFQSGTKTGLALTPNSTQLVATEAKMFSPLSKGTKNAKNYDQAARTIACIAWTIGQSDNAVDDFESLGFYVIAPQEHIKDGVFSSQTSKSSIKEKVRLRVNSYSDECKIYDELQRWYEVFFNPVLGHIDIKCVSWESMVDKVGDSSVRNFYRRCIKFNSPVR